VICCKPNKESDCHIVLLFYAMLLDSYVTGSLSCCLCDSGPAPAGVTEKIFALSKSITEYHTCPDLHVDISTVGSHHFTINGIGEFDVQIVDTAQDYAELMREIFDFAAIRGLLTGADGRPKLNVLVNALHGGEQQYTTSRRIDSQKFILLDILVL